MVEKETASVVWIIDSQHWPRAYLRAELIERGFEAVGYVTLGDALGALHHPRMIKPRIIVLELCEQHAKRYELDALAGVGIPTIVLGGLVELSAELVSEYEWAAVMRRPFAIGKVADMVVKLLQKGTLACK